jgi:hypothetical protein
MLVDTDVLMMTANTKHYRVIANLILKKFLP